MPSQISVESTWSLVGSLEAIATASDTTDSLDSPPGQVERAATSPSGASTGNGHYCDCDVCVRNYIVLVNMECLATILCKSGIKGGKTIFEQNECLMFYFELSHANLHMEKYCKNLPAIFKKDNLCCASVQHPVCTLDLSPFNSFCLAICNKVNFKKKSS